MPFLIRYSTDYPETAWTVLTLSPGPTEVEYPEKRELNIRSTQDHAVVIQRPILDNRHRKWVWKRYRPTIQGYETQWATLASLEARQRSIDGLNPIVQVWEDETIDEGGFGLTTDENDPDLENFTNIDWTYVKFIQVHRQSHKGGGLVIYEDSFMEFVIADPAWENF